MGSETSFVRVISTETIHPNVSARNELGSTPRLELTAWDLPMLSVHYMQKGLLFHREQEPLDLLAQRLKSSLSRCLSYFYPLSGRLATDPTDGTIFVDCNDAGAEFVVAEAGGIRVSDLVKVGDVPIHILRHLFRLDGKINYQGHSLPLLSIQVTELADGLFVGCSLNHAIADGESLWHFFNSWSELSMGIETISRLPVLERPHIHKELGPIRFVISECDLEGFEPAAFRERVFHFADDAIAKLKAKANRQHKPERGDISSLQALLALMWRCMARARNLPVDQTVDCCLAADDRRRVNTPLPREYFGNCVHFIMAEAKVGELLGQDLGWVARLLHDTVTSYTGQVVRDRLERWVRHPNLIRLNLMKSSTTRVGSSPRFEMYSSNFGWGKPLAVLGGTALKYSGKIHTDPGSGGHGGIDLAVCLLPHFMEVLETDEELMDALKHR